MLILRGQREVPKKRSVSGFQLWLCNLETQKWTVLMSGVNIDKASTTILVSLTEKCRFDVI